MAIKESALSNANPSSTSDFVRVVTSEGASRKSYLGNFCKWVLESYTGSTLAGAAQSVKAVLDSLDSNALKAKTAKTAVALRPNADVSGTAVITIPSGALVFTAKVSSSIYHIIYITGTTTYTGYAYSTNFEDF